MRKSKHFKSILSICSFPLPFIRLGIFFFAARLRLQFFFHCFPFSHNICNWNSEIKNFPRTIQKKKCNENRKLSPSFLLSPFSLFLSALQAHSICNWKLFWKLLKIGKFSSARKSFFILLNFFLLEFSFFFFLFLKCTLVFFFFRYGWWL